MKLVTLTIITPVLLLITVLFIVGCQSSNIGPKKAYKYKPHHTEESFKNLYVEDTDKNFFDFLELRFLGDEEWAGHASLIHQVPTIAVDVTRINAKSDMQTETQQPLVTWLGHSMFLVQHNGLNLLTDPIFSNRASPLSFAGPKRYVKHPMDYAELPRIDIVVISHNHYDHLDNATIEELAQRSLQQDSPIQFYVPLGLKSHLIDEGLSSSQVFEMDWWDKAVAQNTFGTAEIQALPSQHWSARGLSDRMTTLWASWSIDFGNFKLWFAGDTGYNDIQFKEIGAALGKVDLALIPIGAYAPRWFMKKYHVNPSEALKIHDDVNAKQSIGMHWGTFPLTSEEPGEPVKVLTQEKEEKGITDEQFITLSIGESMLIESN
ncbi:MAG: N-acyl-phosphatidylethanolamine-hydrolyzing phospholipase D [Granulosicoccus sp.]|jgi:N-acyl-phosphatidylethanolamine-hydrolysing phospholipase D